MAVNPIQLQKHLLGLDYPASKQEVVQHARQRGADQDALSTLESLPRDRFDTPSEVSEALDDLR
jgi:trehalose-6-phosphatase